MWTPFKRTVPETNETKTIDAAKCYIVRWHSFHEKYPDGCLVDSKQRSAAFINIEDANQFRESLWNALFVIQCTIKHEITVEEA